MQAAILIIGDELLAAELTDANGPYFAAELAKLGIATQEIRILPDQETAIIGALQSALSRCELVMVCGGLGPTADDRTTGAVATALDRPLVLQEDIWERIQQIFAAMERTPPPGNEKQATIPEGATVLPNTQGTAPGYVVHHDDRRIAVLPGPPRENRPMFHDVLLPHLREAFPDLPDLDVRVLRTFGLPESEVGARLQSVEADHHGVRIGYQFHFPEILVKVRTTDAAAGQAAVDAVHAELAPYVYGEGDDTLPAVVGRALAAADLSIATAESCTGGLTAQLLTAVPGASRWVDRGFVTYSNRAKQEVLGVPSELLETHGAVSEPVAGAMVVGALANSDADVAVAITGIAGPGGGTADKPVGTVCIGWGDRDTCETKTYRFHWDREYNRRISAWAALHRILLLVGQR